MRECLNLRGAAGAGLISLVLIGAASSDSLAAAPSSAPAVSAQPTASAVSAHSTALAVSAQPTASAVGAPANPAPVTTAPGRGGTTPPSSNAATPPPTAAPGRGTGSAPPTVVATTPTVAPARGTTPTVTVTVPTTDTPASASHGSSGSSSAAAKVTSTASAATGRSNPAGRSTSGGTTSTPSSQRGSSSAPTGTTTGTPAPSASAPVSASPPAPTTSTPSSTPPAARGGSHPTSVASQRGSHSGSRRRRSTSGRAARPAAGTGAALFGGAGSPAVLRIAAAGAALAPAGAHPFATTTVHGSGPAPRSVSSGLGHDLSRFSGLVGSLIPVSLPLPDWSKPIILCLALICLALALRAAYTNRRARRLEDQGQRMAADLESMQAALVPAIPPQLATLAVSVAYRPADGPAAGGDFYDVFALDGGRVAIILGDVSGHGREALARAAHMRYTLRAYMETGLDPRSALKLAGRVVGIEGDGLFTTVAIAVYDSVSATMTYASAGHPAPLLLGPAARQPLEGSASPALGWGAATGRRQTTVPFSEGTRACFFSDGVIEARVANQLLGRRGLLDYFHSTAGDEPSRELLDRVRAAAPAVNDDMAACVLRATAGVAASEHRIEELEVDLEQLHDGQGERFLRACEIASDEIPAAVARARQIAAESSSALLIVEQTGGGAVVTVSEPTTVLLGAPSPTALAIEPAGRTPDASAAVRGGRLGPRT